MRAIRGMDGSRASATGGGGGYGGGRDGEDAAQGPDATAPARTKRGHRKEDEDDPSIPARAERGDGESSSHHSAARIDLTPAKIAPPGEEECHPTDERRNNERRSRTEAQDGPSPPSSAQFVPGGARWGGGCALWNPPPRANFVPSVPTSQSRQAGEKKMNIAVDEDDFSFKPPSIVGAPKCGGGGVRMNNIAISPIVAGAAMVGGEASSRFSFDRSPNQTGRVKNSVAKILATMADAAQRGTTSSSPISRMSASPASSMLRSQRGMSPSECKSSLAGAGGASLAVVSAQDDDNIFSSSTPRDDACIRNPSPPDGVPLPIPESPKNYSFENAPNEPPSESSFPTGASSSASPDISEGDKGGGIGFGYSAFPIGRGDKSIVTTSSSKHVELGQKNAAQDPPVEEEAENDESTASDGEPSLLGVTVVGSKKKRKTTDKRRRLSSPLFETVQEQESMCSAHETEISSPKDETRKQLDPDGFDWKELDAKRNEEDASALIDQGLQRRLSVLALNIVPGIKKEEVEVTIGRATNCSAPPMEGGATVATEGRTHPSLGLRIDIAPKNDNGEFETVMTCNTPREWDKLQNHATKEESDIMNETAFFTSRSVQSDTSLFGGGRITRVHELRSRFESSGIVASLKKSSKRALSSTWQDKSIDSTKNMTSPPPKSVQVTDAPQVTSEEEEQDFDWSLTKSTDSMSIKERRLIFETGNAAPEWSSSLIKESTLIGSGVHLNNREIQAMSSLGCDTLHTTEASVYDNTVGGQSFDTKKVLRYVKALEQRCNQEADEFESILSFENSIEKKDTGNSTKENNSKREVVDANTDGNTSNCDLNFAYVSPVKTCKEAFESKKDQPALARTVAQAHQQLLKKKSEIKEKQSLERKKDAKGASPVKRIVSSATTSSHVDILATSVKDKIAIYSGEEASPIKGLSKVQNKAVPRQLSSPNKPSAPLQQQSKNSVMRGPSRVAVPQTSPPRTIAMNRRTETPSPLWVGKQSDALAFSPNPNISSKPFCGDNPSPNLRPHDFSHVLSSRSSPVRFPASSPLHMRQVTTRNEANQIEGRPAPVQTRYDSPITRECDDDEEDGITLSPTFSEVSGLTIPTCVGTFHGHSTQALTGPDQLNMHRNGTLFHETMSPIARHRQQKETALLTGGAKISSHPYLQRLSAKFPSISTEKLASNVDLADFHDEIKTPKARGSPGVGQGIPPTLRREQLVQASSWNLTSKPTPPKATRNGNSSKSYPSKARRHEWQERNVITENYVKSSNRQEKANGRVAASVEKVNRRVKVSKKSNEQIPNESPYKRSGNHWGAQNENQGDSLKTLDCIRVD
ncbi:hypothetical protein ACHAW5_006266 [Stephanodiscus triporus]|uniref:Uncharacterized protein n=1 Tax=Stephanodiscus triporus TaxID=2934178 RepID=A0ABD3NIF9_9STRA